MILFDLLSVVIFMSVHVVCYPNHFQLLNLPDNKNCCDGNISFWENFYNNAKKSHPFASNRDLIKFITEDMLNLPNADVMFVRAHILNQDYADLDNSHYIFREEFLGTPQEFISLPYHLYKQKQCHIKNYNLSLGMLKRDEIFAYADYKNSMIYDFVDNVGSKPIILSNPNFLKDSEGTLNCPEHPEIQKIIEELENLSLSPQNWTHLCIQELKNKLKSNYSGATKAETTSLKNILSSVVEGEGTIKEMTFCIENRDSPRCKFCHIRTGSEIIIVYYMDPS